MKKTLPILSCFLGLTFSSCQKQYSFDSDIVAAAPTVNTISITDSTIFYYQANIDGTSLAILSGSDGHTTSGGARGGDGGMIRISDILSENTTPTSAYNFSASKGVIKKYSSLTDEQFKSIFTPGNYSFSKFNFNAPAFNAEGPDGFTISWIDKKNTEWRTDNGTADQTGSSIKIISQNRVKSFGDFIFQLRVVIEFNCTVYDGAGNAKKINSGKAALYFPKTI